ncbi:MAG: hypothetical protein PHO29_13095 [Acetobacterium sp.]|nr:hypothetical protein [Acetobacterium sp.]
MENYSGKAAASLVLGIVSVACLILMVYVVTIIIGVICAIIGLILAIQIRKAAQLESFKPSGIATAGLVLSIIGLSLNGVIALPCTLCVICAGGSGALSSLSYL